MVLRAVKPVRELKRLTPNSLTGRLQSVHQPIWLLGDTPEQEEKFSRQLEDIGRIVRHNRPHRGAWSSTAGIRGGRRRSSLPGLRLSGFSALGRGQVRERIPTIRTPCQAAANRSCLSLN